MFGCDQKSWLDSTPPKIAFSFGLVLGVGASALLALAIIIYLFFSGGLPARAGSVAVANKPAAAAPTQPAAAQPTGPVNIKVTSADHSIGPKNAKVTVVEYSDFQCPYCGSFFKTLQQMLTDYKDKVLFVYRNFPLDQIHENARPAAMAAECAGEQGKFFEFHDKLFVSQDKLGDAFYQQTAKDLGLDTGKFNDCLKSDRPGKKVDADYQSGLAAGVQGTPSTFVNGNEISGAQPYTALKAAIDAALK
jgi:protein-disulfide isomerase